MVQLSLWLTDFERNVLDKEREREREGERQYSLKLSFFSFFGVLFLGVRTKWRRSSIYRVGN